MPPPIVAGSLPPNTNLFSSAPPKPNVTTTQPPKPPPFPPILRKSKPKPKPNSKPSNPALKSPHSRTKYHKPITADVIPTSGDRAVVIGDSGVSYLLPGAPFEFQFSYSETPKVRPLAFREPAFLPFGPPTMPRPWTGKAPLKSKKEKEIKRGKRVRLVRGLNDGGEEEEEDGDGDGNLLRMDRDLDLMGRCRLDGRTREEILGRPLSRAEVEALVKPCLSRNRQVNLGRDGLIHNMLELIHSHWRRHEVCKVRCKGVPTVDMDNVCQHLEEKTRGKIIYRVGGVVYLYRGRNYDPRTRPRYPVMLWKPAAPVYPKLIQEAPEGLTKSEADDMRSKGKKLLPICKLAKNGVYVDLVKDVKDAFEESSLVKIDCRGLEPSDYKKIGAKLKDLVPCVLLSFDEEQILMWRGKEWKSKYRMSNTRTPSQSIKSDTTSVLGISGQSNKLIDRSSKGEISSPRMLRLWNKAIATKKALLLDDCTFTPDALLEKVQEFEGMSLADVHSYTVLISSSDNGVTSKSEIGDVINVDSSNSDNDDGNSDDDEDDLFEELESNVPYGMMPVDIIAKRLGED